MNENKETRVDGIFTFKIKWEYDQDADLDWMGEFVRKPDQVWYVDRTEGKLYGDSLSGICFLCREECDSQYDSMWLCDSCYIDDYGVNFPDSDLWNEEVRQSYDTQYISYHYNSWRDLRYWQPSENHCPPKDKDDIKYILEDHKFMEEVAEGSEEPLWLQVTLWVGGIEIDSDSLGGIWGATEEYKEELIQEAIRNLKNSDNLRKAITYLHNQTEEYKTTMERINEYLSQEIE